MKVSFADLPHLISGYQNRLDAVVRQATFEVADLAQLPEAKGGRLPVDTGNLRASFGASLNGGASGSGTDAHVLVAGSMKAGDVASFWWGAEYAKRLNWGYVGTDALGRTYNQQGRHFLEGATMQWQAIVAKVVARAVKEIG